MNLVFKFILIIFWGFTDAHCEKLSFENFKPILQFQGWAVNSIDREVAVTQNSLEEVDSRTNFYFRRARIGLTGNPYERIKILVSLHYDNTGHDSLGATRGGSLPARQGDPVTIGLWDSFLTWNLDTNDLFNLSFGYMRPQISRESLTPAFNVSSFEKSIVQNYVRSSVTGKITGRATGLNLGGMHHKDDFGFRYNLGVFNKMTTGDFNNDLQNNLNETQGSANSLVYIARTEFVWGDPEMTSYGFNLIHNYLGKRNGITLALQASTQDQTPHYRGNHLMGFDILWNHGPWTFDTEFNYIFHKANDENDYSRARTGHLRIARIFELSNRKCIEPSFMFASFYGERSSEFIGRDRVYDLGINYYLNNIFQKLYIHYVWQSGSGNNLQGNASSFQYGDYLGAGFSLQI